jgi:hypothetical protein
MLNSTQVLVLPFLLESVFLNFSFSLECLVISSKTNETFAYITKQTKFA